MNPPTLSAVVNKYVYAAVKCKLRYYNNQVPR